MTIEEAKKYWEHKYNRAKDYSDVHWEADERYEHQEYVEALQMAVKALEENTELKRLLRLAVEDFERFRCLMSSDINEEFCETALEYHCNPYDLCNSCPLSGSEKCRWKHAEEALKLLGDDDNEQY